MLSFHLLYSSSDFSQAFMIYFLKSYCFGKRILGIASVRKNLMKEVKKFWEMIFSGAKGGEAQSKAKSFAFMKNTFVFHSPNPPICF